MVWLSVAGGVHGKIDAGEAACNFCGEQGGFTSAQGDSLVLGRRDIEGVLFVNGRYAEFNGRFIICSFCSIKDRLPTVLRRMI